MNTSHIRSRKKEKKNDVINLMIIIMTMMMIAIYGACCSMYSKPQCTACAQYAYPYPTHAIVQLQSDLPICFQMIVVPVPVVVVVIVVCNMYSLWIEAN